MPRFQKHNLPYMHMGNLVIPVNAPERYRYWDIDWDGKRGLSVLDLIEGLGREDLIPRYIDSAEAVRRGIVVERPARQIIKEPEKESFQLR